MSRRVVYLAMGEESVRGTKESTTVGFIPLLSPSIPKVEFDERRRREFRGEDVALGDTKVLRMGQKWSASLEIPFFTEAGSTGGMMGTILKHFFGKSTSSENGTTGQYTHMMYPVSDPFDGSNLGGRALTVNLNIDEGGTVKNWPFVGGRVSSLGFEQSPGEHLKLTVELFGQRRDTVTSEIGSPVFPPENLRCDYTSLSVYTGTITRTGTAPDYSDFSFSSATPIKPDRISLKMENGMEDVLILSGVDYPEKTRIGQFKVSLELTIDWEDPQSGFSSVDEFNSWMDSSSTTNFFLHWDTGTQAGTGDNHGLYIDLPCMQRMGGEPEFDLEKDPVITLRYEGLYDSTTKYMVGVMLKNTSSGV